VENGAGLLTVREALGAMRQIVAALEISRALPRHHTKG